MEFESHPSLRSLSSSSRRARVIYNGGISPTRLPSWSRVFSFQGVTMDSAYANPQPYGDPDLERSILAGRIKAARKISAIFQGSGDAAQASRWAANVDTLLEHFTAADDRATSKAMEQP